MIIMDVGGDQEPEDYGAYLFDGEPSWEKILDWFCAVEFKHHIDAGEMTRDQIANMRVGDHGAGTPITLE